MLEIGTSGLMSGERKRAAQFLRADTAPFLDSTPPEPPQTEPLTPSDPTPETTPADPNTLEPPAVDSGNPWDPPFWFTNGLCHEGCVCPKCLELRRLAADAPSPEDIPTGR
jgi:hypothetical protein